MNDIERMRDLIDDMPFANLKSPDISPLDLTNRFGETCKKRQGVIFDVDLSKIADDFKLFFDPNYKFAFYCYQNIGPDSISRCGTINTNEENPRIEWN